MSVRAAVAAFAVVSVAGVVALLIAGAGDQRTTAFSLDVPNTIQVTDLFPGTAACQGPLSVQSEFQGFRAWISPAAAPSLRATVYNSRGARLATGQIRAQPGVPGPYVWRLSAPVAAHEQVSVCLRNLGPAPVGLIGSSPSQSAGSLKVGSKATATAAAMVFLRPHPRNLLATLPALFARAALFKASWVGAWTFWLLCALILAAFAIAARSVALATAEDAAATEAQGRRDSPQKG